MDDLGQAGETVRQAHAGNLFAVGVPVGDAVEQRPRAHGGDEGIDAEKRHQETVDEADQQRREQDQRGGHGPRQPLVDLQADAQHLRQAEVVADRKVELLGGERHHGGERQNGRHRLADENRIEVGGAEKARWPKETKDEHDQEKDKQEPIVREKIGHRPRSTRGRPTAPRRCAGAFGSTMSFSS